MQIYFAPMEGVTDFVYRRAHRDCFSGVTKYFIPFISPTQNMRFSLRESQEISPAENDGVPVVPQVLTRNAKHFLWFANCLKDLGHEELNLNLGCPSGTVTAKGKGSGMLKDLAGLEAFLDEIFAHPPLKISIKTRIGFESTEEWPKLAALFARYPISELIVHPRTRTEFYKGTPHRELLGEVRNSNLVYNGDLFTAQECRAFLAEYPGTSALMLGRGLVANPALAQELAGGEPLTDAAFRRFHDRLYRDYLVYWPKNAVIGHMLEILSYMLGCVEEPSKPRKALRKSRTLEDYERNIDDLFAYHPLRENPGFAGLK